MMNSQEQNWQRIFGHLTKENNSMYGIWTVYSLENTVLRSFKGIRTLEFNDDKTVIIHRNQFLEENTPEKQWQIDKEICNLPDGLLHPASASKRAISLGGKGVDIWFSQKLEAEGSFSVELFLKHEGGNNSIGSIYTNGCLEKILQISEKLGGFPEMVKDNEFNKLSGYWLGKKQTITAVLEVLPEEKIEANILESNNSNNETFFLDNNVIVNIPKQIEIGKEFEIIAGKLITDNEYKRLTAKYDKLGQFSQLISEVFIRKNSP